MSAEIPDFHNGTPDNGATPETYISLYDVDLLEKMQELRKKLSERAADITTHTFGFHGDYLNVKAHIPPQIYQLAVANRYDNLLAITVECSSGQASSLNNIDVHIQFQKEGSPNLRISMLRPCSYSPSPDNHDTAMYLLDEFDDEFEGDNPTEKVDPVSPADFNCLLASLISNDDNIKISAYKDFDWHNEDFDILTRNFNASSQYKSSSYEYTLDAGDGSPAALLRYDTYDGGADDGERIIDIELERIVINHIDVSSEGNIGRYLNTVEAKVWTVGNIPTEFWERTQRDEENLTGKPINSSIAEYTAMMEFIDRQLMAINPASNERFDEIAGD